MTTRSWLHLAADARRKVEFRPMPRRFLNLPTVRITFGNWVLVGRIRKWLTAESVKNLKRF